MKVNLLLFSLFCVFIEPAFAFVYGGSNLGYLGYPEPRCYIPYNGDNWQKQEYVRCINDYVENAQNDIKRIREKAEDAVEKAKQNLIYTY